MTRRSDASSAAAAATASAAFTLLELVLALALMALITAVLMGVSSRLLENKPKTPEEIFWQAVQEARHDALVQGRDVQLSFDNQKKELVIGTDPPETFPIAGYDDVEIDFIDADDSGVASNILIGGTAVATDTIPYVVFHDDGTCTRFRAQVRVHGGAHLVDVDPWTCAPLLPPPPKAPPS